jgi:hypothetical protein
MTHEVALSLAREGEIEYHLMRYRDRKGQYRAGVIGMLTMYPDARRQEVRLLAEIDARGSPRPDTTQSSFAMHRSSILGPERDIQRPKPCVTGSLGVITARHVTAKLVVPDLAHEASHSKRRKP